MGTANTARQIWAKKTWTIPSGDTLSIDEITSADFYSAHYFLEANIPATGDIKSMRISAKKSGVGTLEQVFSRSGTLNMEVTTVIESGKYKLKVKNNEADEMKLCLLKARA